MAWVVKELKERNGLRTQDAFGIYWRLSFHMNTGMCKRTEDNRSFFFTVLGSEGLFHTLNSILNQRVHDSCIVDRWLISLVSKDVFHLQF